MTVIEFMQSNPFICVAATDTNKYRIQNTEFSRHCQSQEVTAMKLKIERMFTPHHMSGVGCQGFKCEFFLDKVVEIVGGGSIINRA